MIWVLFNIFGIPLPGIFLKAPSEVVGIGYAHGCRGLVHLDIVLGQLDGLFHAALGQIFEEITPGLLFELTREITGAEAEVLGNRGQVYAGIRVIGLDIAHDLFADGCALVRRIVLRRSIYRLQLHK